MSLINTIALPIFATLFGLGWIALAVAGARVLMVGVEERALNNKKTRDKLRSLNEAIGLIDDVIVVANDRLSTTVLPDDLQRRLCEYHDQINMKALSR